MSDKQKENEMSDKPEVIAAPGEGFVALRIPASMIPRHPGVDGLLIRFRSADGFRAFMVAAINAAAETWPEIEAEWNDA